MSQPGLNLRDLFQNYSSPVKRYLMKLGADTDTAEDLLQEVFLAACRYSHSYDSEKGELSSWIYAIARNLFYKYNRKNSETGVDFQSHDFPDLNQNTSQRFEDEDGIKTLKNAVHSLTEIEQKIITARYFRRMSIKDCAAELNVSEKTVSRKLTGAMKQLKDILKKEDFSDL